MKDYSKDKKERKTFIKNYSIADNKILCNLANHKLYKIPFTSENEGKVLDKMEDQIINGEENINEINIKLFYDVIYLSFLIPLFIILGIKGTTSIILNNSLLTGIAIATTISALDIVNKTKKILDFKKNKNFIESKNTINDNINSNKNIVSGLNFRNKHLIKKQKEITINDLDKISSKELKTLKENITRYYELNLNESYDVKAKQLSIGKRKY